MIRYVIANTTTGEIVRTCCCSQEQAAVQAAAGEVVIQSDDAISFTHHVVNGALVAYTAPQQAAKMVRPFGSARWDNTTMSWTDLRPLAEAKGTKRDELRAAALAAANANLTVQGVTFAVSQDIRAELAQELALAQAEGAGYSCEWERADGTAITLTGVQVRGLLRAMSNRAQAIRSTLRSKLALVQAAATAAAVDAITWS